jgi:branched-chain amino acid transport system substrate-binding protein
MIGTHSWAGEQFERGVEMAIADLNTKRGVLGQSVELIVGDDFCGPNQAAALARKLASDGVVFVAGHLCSHSSIAASKIYEKARILQITPASASARLTDEGGPNVFRVCGRDDRQGAMVGDYLAEHWADDEIAILDDGTTWGAGVANGVRCRLQERGIRGTVDETITPGEAEYSALVSKMQAAEVDVFFLGGLQRETGLVFRQAHDRGYNLGLVSSSSGQYESFPLIAGPGLEGTVMVANTDTRASPHAAEVLARFRAQVSPLWELGSTPTLSFRSGPRRSRLRDHSTSMRCPGHPQPPVRPGAG